MIEVVGTAFQRLFTAKVPFCCAQPRTQPQIAVFVSAVVIAKGTLLRLCPVFRRNYFGCVCFLAEVVSTLSCNLSGTRYSVLGLVYCHVSNVVIPLLDRSFVTVSVYHLHAILHGRYHYSGILMTIESSYFHNRSILYTLPRTQYPF